MSVILLSIGGTVGIELGLIIAVGRSVARADARHDEALAQYGQQLQSAAGPLLSITSVHKRAHQHFVRSTQ